MPRKPNYKFERMERDRQKAEKKRIKQEAKAAAREAAKGPQNPEQAAAPREPDQT
jgi:hypothetical protein